MNLPLIAIASPLLTIVPTPTTEKMSPEQLKVMGELVKGLFSENMKQIVVTVPTDKFLIYAFLIIAVVLIVSLVIILKISSGSVNKAILTSISPYVEQLGNFQKAFERSQESYDKMATKFSRLTEEIVKSQTLRIGEEDRFDSLNQHFQEMNLRFHDNMTSLFTVFREHEKNSYERQLEIQKYNQKVSMSLLEMRANCSLASRKRVGEILVEKGYATRAQLNEVLEEQLTQIEREG
jgi:DNA anti-recombination protein RmuC